MSHEQIGFASCDKKKMDFAILSSVCLYFTLISIYVFKNLWLCCCTNVRIPDDEEGQEDYQMVALADEGHPV